MPTTKEISKLRITGSLWGDPPVTGEFPSQRANGAEGAYLQLINEFNLTQDDNCSFIYAISIRYMYDFMDFSVYIVIILHEIL